MRVTTLTGAIVALVILSVGCGDDQVAPDATPPPDASETVPTTSEETPTVPVQKESLGVRFAVVDPAPTSQETPEPPTRIPQPSTIATKPPESPPKPDTQTEAREAVLDVPISQIGESLFSEGLTGLQRDANWKTYQGKILSALGSVDEVQTISTGVAVSLSLGEYGVVVQLEGEQAEGASGLSKGDLVRYQGVLLDRLQTADAVANEGFKSDQEPILGVLVIRSARAAPLHSYTHAFEPGQRAAWTTVLGNAQRTGQAALLEVASGKLGAVTHRFNLQLALDINRSSPTYPTDLAAFPVIGAHGELFVGYSHSEVNKGHTGGMLVIFDPSANAVGVIEQFSSELRSAPAVQSYTSF